MPTDDYVSINRDHWNSRVPHHVIGYDLDRYRHDPTTISHVVAFDRPRLGDIAGLDVVHLQCHIGTDTLSLARLGARSVTGIDFSPPALEAAAALAAECHTTIRYRCAELYEAPTAVEPGSFDLVYTGIGALCWLPDIRRWADVVAALLRPGGRLFLREGHPMLWALADPRDDELVVVDYPYFEVPGGTELYDDTTYVAHTEPLASPRFRHFNHGLAEIVNALWNAGLVLDAFDEHTSAPWNPLGSACVPSPVHAGEWQLRDHPERLAATYTLQAHKPRRTS